MIQINPSALKEIKRLLSQKNSHLFFRLQIQAGGCSGLFYDMGFDAVIKQGDRVFNCTDISVIVDAQSLNYISNLTIDYSEDLMGGGFRFHNPQAIASCGCGNSFSVDRDKIS